MADPGDWTGDSLTTAQRGAIWLLRLYKLLLSPMFAGSCRFLPSCSDYARDAVAVHGVIEGTWLAARRLSRCHPFGSSGHDPVPRPRIESLIASMEKRVLLAVALSFVVLYGYQADVSAGSAASGRDAADARRHRGDPAATAPLQSCEPASANQRPRSKRRSRHWRRRASRKSWSRALLSTRCSRTAAACSRAGG